MLPAERTELVPSARLLHRVDVLRLLALEPVLLGKQVLKVLRLEDGELVQDKLESLDVQDAVLVEVPACEFAQASVS